ncbi:MAG: Energy-coupling factor transporter transmembrane protein EcfT [Methanocella sp. PtaU1.Bin125]|nr:MAG: Energy-coupling factor transporter transmembrane protein EcfT [Methanocella sp. PtaU1.Bin125]
MRIRYEPGTTFVHALNPMTKLAALVLFSIGIFLVASIPVEAVVFLSLVALIALIRARAIASLLASRFLLSFTVLLFLVQVVFNAGGAVYFSIPLILFSIPVTAHGVAVGVVLALRFVCIILASAIFVFTTDPGELAYALIRAGVPYRYGFMLVTAIRFIPVFEAEAGTVRCAQQARGLDIDGKGFRALLNSARYTLMPLVVSALSKVDVLVISMEGRAFGVRPRRTSLREGRFTLTDAAVIVLAILVFTLLLYFAFTGQFQLPQIVTYDD